MVLFKSIVVLDTETTGMPQMEHNCTRIIEIACFACETAHIRNSKELPRVLHKLVLCFRPGKMISPGATDTSGLSNEILDNVSSFQKDDVDMIIHFVKRLPQPVCLIAHNGLKFDFPILRRMIMKLNCSFPNNVYCADSLIAFREIYPNSSNGSYQTGVKNLKEEIETTPKSNRTVPTNSLNYKKGYSRSFSADVSRNLFPDVGSSGTHTQCEIPASWESYPSGYRMQDIYFFLHGRNFPNVHRAEEDTKALLSCIIKAEGFLNWINRNAVIFNSIEPLF